MTTECKKFINQNTQVFNNINITYVICCNTNDMVCYIITNSKNSTLFVKYVVKLPRL